MKPDVAKETWEMLDAYEGVTGEAGDEYVRAHVECYLEDGSQVRAQTYVSTVRLDGCPRIASGDYTAFYRQNKEHQRFVNGG